MTRHNSPHGDSGNRAQRGVAMTLRLQFTMDNAAFTENLEGFEAARILCRISDHLENGETEGLCMDANGNRVGEWEVTP